MSVDGAGAGPLRKDENWVGREIDGETVLIPLRRGAADLQFLLLLNSTASWIWERLDGVRTSDDLTRAVVAEFEIDSEQAAADVKDLLRSFCEVGLASPC